jgi:hypothetical protein
MGEIHEHSSALLLVAAFSRYDDALAWARGRAEAAWGPLALVSEPFEFVETDYYASTMGPGLKKQFLAFERPFDPGELAQIKLATNQWELDYAGESPAGEPRPLNLDPGYVTLAKLVLASTKDHAHRIYLSQGIYAEVTLHYQHRAWRHSDWTFPDYRRADYHRLFDQCRALVRQRRAGGDRA